LPKLSAQISERTLRVGDRERTYLSYVPKSLAPGAALVLVLHGSTMDGATMRAWTAYEFDALADARGFVVVYPDGYRHNWNDCRRSSPTPAKRENVDDVGFLKALIAQEQKDHGISVDRVFAFGYSNGGQMAYRLMLEAPGTLQAIAVAGSSLPSKDNFICPLEGATAAVMLVHGTKDPLIPFEGGEATIFGFFSRGNVISANATAESFASRNGLTEAPQTSTLPHVEARDETSVELRTWSRDGKPFVVQYVVRDGGHVVPQPAFRYPRALGATTRDLDAPARAIEFFLR